MWIDFVGLTHSPTILRAIFRKRAETSFLFRMLPWICRKKIVPAPALSIGEIPMFSDGKVSSFSRPPWNILEPQVPCLRRSAAWRRWKRLRGHGAVHGERHVAHGASAVADGTMGMGMGRGETMEISGKSMDSMDFYGLLLDCCWISVGLLLDCCWIDVGF